MKPLRQIILALTILMFNCQQTKNREIVDTTDSSSNNTIENHDKIEKENLTDNVDQSKDFDKYDMLFKYEDKEQDFKQRLGVTWLANDSIEFRLLTEDEICDTNYWGNAKNNHADMDPEMDEDENGESYATAEYVAEEQTYTMSIRVSLDRDKARIIYTDKSGEETDCVPTPNLILVKQ